LSRAEASLAHFREWQNEVKISRKKLDGLCKSSSSMDKELQMFSDMLGEVESKMADAPTEEAMAVLQTKYERCSYLFRQIDSEQSVLQQHIQKARDCLIFAEEQVGHTRRTYKVDRDYSDAFKQLVVAVNYERFRQMEKALCFESR